MVSYLENRYLNLPRYFWFKYACVRRWQQLRHGAPVPHALDLLEVDPRDIVRRSHTRPEDKWQYAGRVAAGNWDIKERTFAEGDTQQSLIQHFVDGVPWTRTLFYPRIIAEIEAGSIKWGCSTTAEFEARCQVLDALFEDIRSSGVSHFLG